MVKGGRKLINSILLFCIYSSILIYLVVHYAIIERYFDITNPILYVLLAALIFISALLKVELKLFLTTDKLKVYSDGLSLPRRTFSEWLKGEEHFIPYKDIKEIVIETHYRTGRPLWVKIVKKDGTVETLGASWFLDLDEFKRVIIRQGRVVIREEEKFV